MSVLSLKTNTHIEDVMCVISFQRICLNDYLLLSQSMRSYIRWHILGKIFGPHVQGIVMYSEDASLVKYMKADKNTCKANVSPWCGSLKEFRFFLSGETLLYLVDGSLPFVNGTPFAGDSASFPTPLLRTNTKLLFSLVFTLDDQACHISEIWSKLPF